MEIYKIRNKEGLFYKNSEYFGSLAETRRLNFDQKGIEFLKLNQIEKLIKEVKDKYTNAYLLLKDCEIVKFELIEKEIINIE